MSKLNKFNIVGILVRSVIGLLMNFLYFGIVYTAVLADINISIIISILALTPFISAIAFYFVFKESLNRNHFMGMIIMTICIFILTNSSPAEASTEGTIDNKVHPQISVSVPVIIALILTVVVTLNNLSGRYIFSKSKMTST